MKKTLYSFILLLLFYSPAFSAILYVDLIYNQSEIIQSPTYFQYGKNPYHLAKLYVANTRISKPLIILAPGSGFSDSGDVILASHDQAMLYARRGYAVMVINYYRVHAPGNNLKGTIAEAAADVYAAIQYAANNGGGYFNIDINNTFILGESAGGIASTAALWLNKSDFQNRYQIDKNKSSKYTSDTYNVRGLCLLSSGVEDIDIFKNRSSCRNIPTFMLHGVGDLTVPFYTGIPGAPTLSGAGSIYKEMAADPTFNCGVLYAFTTYKHNLLTALPLVADSYYPGYYHSWVNAAIATGFYNIMKGVCIKNSVLNPVTPTSRTSDEQSQETNELSENDVFFKDGNLIVRTTAVTSYSCQIHDLQGNMVYNNSNVATNEVNVNGLQAGLYVVSIQSENKNFRLKILKE